MADQYFRINNLAFTKKLALVVTILFVAAIVISVGRYSQQEQNQVDYASITDTPTPTPTEPQPN